MNILLSFISSLERESTSNVCNKQQTVLQRTASDLKNEWPTMSNQQEVPCKLVI